MSSVNKGPWVPHQQPLTSGHVIFTIPKRWEMCRVSGDPGPSQHPISDHHDVIWFLTMEDSCYNWPEVKQQALTSCWKPPIGKDHLPTFTKSWGRYLRPPYITVSVFFFIRKNIWPNGCKNKLVGGNSYHNFLFHPEDWGKDEMNPFWWKHILTKWVGLIQPPPRMSRLAITWAMKKGPLVDWVT